MSIYKEILKYTNFIGFLDITRLLNYLRKPKAPVIVGRKVGHLKVRKIIFKDLIFKLLDPT